MRCFFLLLLLSNSLVVSGQSIRLYRNSDPKIFEIVEIGKNGQVLLVYDGSDTATSLRSKNWQNEGFPKFDLSDYNGDWYNLALPDENRYLAIWEKKYCVIDSLLNVVIDFSDTIVGFGNDEWCDKGDQIIPYSDNEASVFFYYEAVRNGQTFLYDNRGNLLLPKPFEGFLLYKTELRQCTGPNDSRFRFLNAIFYTVSSDHTTFGVIARNGNVLIPLGNYQIFWPHDSQYRFMECCPVNARAGTPVIFYDLKNFCFTKPSEDGKYIHFDFDTFPFLAVTKTDELKQGLYHPYYGTILRAEYDKILELTPRNCKHYNVPENKRGDCLLLLKGNKKKLWKIPEKYRTDQ